MEAKPSHIPLQEGYEPTAFQIEGARAQLFVGDKLMGDVLQYDHGSHTLPHMGLRNMQDTETDELA